ncbi:hypothetical protein [Mesotoga sp.]|uniref:hypothetical protein n=1 Tax=Mesotoga sp. TaxID=2053577 RepID=UPI00345E1246
MLSVKANKYGIVAAEKNGYSTAPELSLRELWLRAGRFHSNDTGRERYEVVTHTRSCTEKQEAFNLTFILPTIVKAECVEIRGLLRPATDSMERVL